MNIYQAAILGIIQGLTEFLPVSSSGHLVLFQHLFGLKEAELLFDISVHLGTLAAVVIFFRSDISAIIVSVFRYCKKVFNTRSFTIAKDDFELILPAGWQEAMASEDILFMAADFNEIITNEKAVE
ncbi:MAG: undecaprenyl-diphosphate phosphatase, partial [Proteobacteria bacterium]|nr:undecaprenyl-diphosphate phosphatase [Pseudomonadota bacterium]